MSRPLPRFVDTSVADERALARILRETGLPARAPSFTLAEASPQDLRGIPVIGRGVGGTSPGTDPLNEALRLDWLR